MTAITEKPRKTFKPRTWRCWVRWALAFLALYVGTSFLAHGLRHPEMTDVQRFLDAWRALTWR